MGKNYRIIALGVYLVILVFYIVPINAAHNNIKTFSIEIPQPIVSNESGVIYYNIRGFQSTTVPYMPKLPFRAYFFDIPDDAGNIDVYLTADSIPMGSVKDIGISKPVIISTSHSAGVTISGAKKQIESNMAESKDGKFPKTIYSIDGIRQIGKHRVLAVSIYPLQYDSSTNELKFYKNISIEIRYDNAANPKENNATVSFLAEKIAEEAVYNSNYGNATNENASSIKYVIITTPDIAPALEPLRDWKTKKGIPAGIYTTDWIYGKYNGTLNYVFHSGSGDRVNNSMEAIIDLRNASRANLSFSTMFNIEYGWDFGYVEVSKDGLNWKQLNGTFMTSYRDNKAYVGIPGAMAYTGNMSWIRDKINLDSYAGNVTYLRFRYETDTYVSHGGWYLDNITINTDKGIILSDNGNNSGYWEFSGFGIVDINSRFNPAQKLIRDFIRDMSNNGAEWVLLAGDDNNVPAMRVQRTWYQELGDNDVVPTDYYYADLEGNWDTDNDQIYGEREDVDSDEITDWLPDIYVGRLPASNKDEMEKLVNKILRYEKNPNIASSWFNRAVFAAGESDKLTDEGYLKDLVKNNSFKDYNITRLYYLNNYAHEYPLDYSNVRDQLSIGQSIVNLAGHGDYRSIAQCLTCSTFIDTNMNLANGDMSPLVYSDSCDTGAFDQGINLGKTAIMNWAIGFIGSTRTSYYVQDWQPGSGVNQEMDYRFWEQFSNGSYRSGEALFRSKAWYVLYQLGHDDYPDAAKKNLVDYNLLGDPEIPIWTDTPRNFVVYFPEKIYTARQNTSMIVRNSSNQTVSDAIVAIQKGNEIYDHKKTDSKGKVEFSINPLTDGELEVTVTKHNFLPFEGNITIESDREPPKWTSKTGISSAKAGNKEILLYWGNAFDPSGVRYNLYYSTIRYWLPLYFNVNATEINDSKFNLLVLDPDELNPADIEMLKNSGKFVIAYIDVGKAEDRRKYWNGSKDWILENDSESHGEYFVDYSNGEWQKIIRDYVNEIRAKGFDGILMGNVEDGYHRYEDVNLSICRNCTKFNMIKFIKNISQTYRQHNFSIFVQNGLDIALNISDYADGFSVEGTYYYGTGNMTGKNLTEAREAIMDTLLSNGSTILTLDYTENESEIDFVYNRSLTGGYIPYVSTKKLNQVIINKNHEPKSVAENGIKIENVTSPYAIKNLTNGKIYYFSIRAIDDFGNEDKNNATLASVPSASLGCLLKGDKDCDGRINDFELLDYVNIWAKNIATDFDLLEVINNWAKG